MQDHGNCHNA